MKNSIITVILILVTILSFTGCDRKTGTDLMFYYFETCPSCEEYQLAELYKDKIGELNGKKQWTGISRNLVSPEAAKELKDVLQEKGLPDVSRSLPLLIMGDEYINGYEAIGEKLEELQAGTGN